MTLAATPVINVLVAHSDPLVAMGVAATLAGRHDFAVRQVGADGGPEEAALAAGGIDVIVADFEEGTRLAERRRERRPGDARILILTAQDGERDIRRALELGVHGYARTNRPLQEFIDGVRALHRGARHLCPMTAQRLAESLMRGDAHRARDRRALAAGPRQLQQDHRQRARPGRGHRQGAHQGADVQARTRAPATQVVTVAVARGLVSPLTMGRSPARPASRRHVETAHALAA